MRQWLLLGAGAAILLAVTVGAAVALRHRDSAITVPAPSPYRGSIPPAGIRAPEFNLRDYRGENVTTRDLRGRVEVVSFVDSKCTQKCPIVTSVIALALRRLPSRTRREIVAVLISVNPNVDTPASIERFLTARRARALYYLVGSVQELRPVWKAYGVLPAVDTGNPDIHSSDVRIFDRKGIWVSTQHAGVDLTASNLDHDINLALQGAG